jgi:branched-chain amino acid transport system permease protein
MVNITGAEDGFTYPVPDIVNTTQNRLFFYYLVLVLLVACYLLVQRLMDSPTGRALAAIRENEDRARMIGFQTINYKLIALVVSGFMATGAGILRGIANKGASPNVLGAGVTIDALLKTIIGGAGTFMGPVVGAFGLNLTEHALRDTEIMIGATTVDIGKYWALILGILFIVTVLLFPQGLVGTWMKNRDRLLDRFRPGKPDTST